MNFGANSIFVQFPGNPPVTAFNSTSVDTSNGDVEIVIQQPDTHTISGTVVDSTGSPVSNLTVELSNTAGSNILTTTDTQGQYSFTVSPGFYSLNFLMSGGAQLFNPYAGYYNLQTSDVTQHVHLPPTVNLTVTAEDANGNPVSGATVNIAASPTSFTVAPGVTFDANHDASQVTGPDGQATFHIFQGMNFGANSISVQYPGDSPTTARNATAVDTSNGDVAVVLQEPVTHAISGTVVDSTGLPVSNLTVEASNTVGSNTFTTTDSQGRYSFTLSPDSYSLGFFMPSGAQLFNPYAGYYDLRTGDVTQNVKLPPMVNLTVTAKDADGNPVSGATVNIAASITPFTVAPGVTFDANHDAGRTTDANGQATFQVFQGMNFGANSIFVQFPGNPPVTARNATAVDTSSDATIVVRLQPQISSPSAPTNLTISSPTQTPALSWGAANGASSYNIYRNGTKVDSTIGTTYTDNTAPEGTDTYYVTAANSAGDSGASNSVNVLVDRTVPTITYSVEPASNGAGWNNSPVTITFSCSDMLSGIASCSPPMTESSDGTYTFTGTAVDNAGNTALVSVTVKVDQSMPMVGTPTWSDNPVVTGNSTTLTVPAIAAANHSPTTGGEYYIGNTDPGQGNGTAMTYDSNSGNLTASLGSSLSPGTYQVNARAQNAAGVWSSIVTTTLKVNPVPVAPTVTSPNNYSIGVRQIITSSEFTVTTTGTPAPSLTETGSLPSGIAFSDNGDGTANFTGMVAAGTAGTYHITITATNSAGSISQNFALTITDTDSAPTTIFTSTGSNTLTVNTGTSSSFTFTATGNGKNSKISVFSGSLPPGMSLHDNKDGTASFFGTPTQAGTYTFTLEAQNKNGITYQQFMVVVN
jgi:protocatechuate 3,4-dioxygenase beta subunit